MISTRAKQERDEELEELAMRANDCLTGRTIVAIDARPHNPDCDSANVLVLHLDDGSFVNIEGGYGGYTGDSCDEYVETLSIESCRL